MRGSICRSLLRTASACPQASPRRACIVPRRQPARCLSSSPGVLPHAPASRAAKPDEQEEEEGEEDDGKDDEYDRRYTTRADIQRSGRDRPPRDFEITDPKIIVIDNGVAEGPLDTKFVLSKLLPEESLRMVTPYVPGRIKVGREPSLAVCKIVDKKEDYERQRQAKERKKAAAAAKPRTKELEMTWAIGGNDLDTKMTRLRHFLEKGMKVEMTIGRKKGGRSVATEQAGEVLKVVRGIVEETGGREGKPSTGSVGGSMKLYLEGVRRT